MKETDILKEQLKFKLFTLSRGWELESSEDKVSAVYSNKVLPYITIHATYTKRKPIYKLISFGLVVNQGHDFKKLLL